MWNNKPVEKQLEQIDHWVQQVQLQTERLASGDLPFHHRKKHRNVKEQKVEVNFETYVD